MTTFMISYDLRTPGRDYASLTEHLKSWGDWWHNLGSTWFIKSTATAGKVRDERLAHMDSNDRIVVVKASAPGEWSGFTSSANDWLMGAL